MNKRFKSLDVFRGMTIAAMILVNTPGSWAYIYAPLQHADWNGYTPTDLVFPFFLFAVGLSMAFSFRNLDGLNAKAYFLRTFKRSTLIFIIGLALTAFPFIGKDLGQLRILGVLQRIALAYFFASAVVYWFKTPKQLAIFSVLTLLFYWSLFVFWGGEEPYSLEDNLVRKLDLLILGEAHMWHGKKIAFDPEGLLSTLPAIVSITIGYIFSLLIQSMKHAKQLLKLAGISLAMLLLGYLWSPYFPINKALWTSSYVLVSSGIAGLVLVVIIYVIDFANIQKWSKPFEIFGMNPLISFIASILWVKIYFLIRIDGQSAYGWLYNELFKGIVNPTFGSLVFALVHVFGCWLLAWWLYKRHLIIKL